MAIVGTGVTYDLGLRKYHRTTQEIRTLLLVSRDRPLPNRNSEAGFRRNLRGTTRVSGILVKGGRGICLRRTDTRIWDRIYGNCSNCARRVIRSSSDGFLPTLSPSLSTTLPGLLPNRNWVEASRHLLRSLPRLWQSSPKPCTDRSECLG